MSHKHGTSWWKNRDNVSHFIWGLNWTVCVCLLFPPALATKSDKTIELTQVCKYPTHDRRVRSHCSNTRTDVDEYTWVGFCDRGKVIYSGTDDSWTHLINECPIKLYGINGCTTVVFPFDRTRSVPLTQGKYYPVIRNRRHDILEGLGGAGIGSKKQLSPKIMSPNNYASDCWKKIKLFATKNIFLQ